MLAREQLNGPISFGIIFTALGLASTVGAVVAGSRKAPARLGWLLLAGTAWVGLGGAVIAIAQTLPAVLVAMVAGGAIASRSLTLLFWLCAASIVAVAAASTMSRPVRQMS